MKRNFGLIFLATFLVVGSTVLSALAQSVDKGADRSESCVDLRLDLNDRIGIQMRNVVQNWVLRAPKANPAIWNVMRLRDRAPKTSEYYVPWVGEFIGKFLTNSILLTQTTDDPEVKKTVDAMLNALIESQDEDGYFGPFPKQERLIVCWDLWGCYHAITALNLYYERFGDTRALESAKRAGDFVCATFLDSDKRAKDVGSDEMNLAVMTSLCQLYRLTGEERYFKTAQEILKDLEDCGDFYREGLAGTEFYQTPRPRWESLHTIVGFSELYKITGDESYKRAFLNLWESIRARDIHNNGSFSSGEQAVGSPFKEGAIETCCTVAWTAATVEALRLTGDSRCADELEKTLYNAVAAYTHPSGSYCTYNTPMNGRREASFHTIVFQSRPGQPELNCCSVNGPRGFAELVEWGVTKGRDASGDDAIFVNYYGAGETTFEVDGKRVKLIQRTNYPLGEDVEIELATEDDDEIETTLNLRVPAWARDARLSTKKGSRVLEPGRYYAVKRVWKRGESIKLTFPMKLRYESGDGDFAGCVSVFRGPLLFAYDQRFNSYDSDVIPTITPETFANARLELPPQDPERERIGDYAPWALVKLNAPDGTPVTLVDFASAGSLGTTYASWIPAEKIAPPVPACDRPRVGERVAPGARPFSWRNLTDSTNVKCRVDIFDSATLETIVATVNSEDGKTALADLSNLASDKTYYWKVVVENEFGSASSSARPFSIDDDLPPFDRDAYLTKKSTNTKFQTLIEDDLRGKANPTVGTVERAQDVKATQGTSGENDGAVQFDGKSSMIVYTLDAFPRVEFEATLDFMIDARPREGKIGQIISAWTRGNDDPLRVAIDQEGKIYGAVEGKRGGMTLHTPVEKGVWHSLRVVKEKTRWSIWIDEEETGTIATERVLSTESLAVGLGCNPKYTGEPEFLNGKIARFRLSGIVEE